MRHALILSVFSSAFLVLTTLSGTTGDPGPQPASNLQDDSSPLQSHGQPSALISGDVDEEKRSWRDLQNGWGKRGWKDLHGGGWGKRGWKDLQSTGWGKRSWGDLQNGWGKRNRWDSQDFLDKRAWSDLKGGAWGKRDWSQFRGGWGKRDIDYPNLYDYSLNPMELEEEEELEGSRGKRDPAWQNLKGLWGKRSDSKWSKLKGQWG